MGRYASCSTLNRSMATFFANLSAVGVVVLRDVDGAPFAVVHGDGFAVGPEVEAVDGFVVLADVVTALLDLVCVK